VGDIQAMGKAYMIRGSNQYRTRISRVFVAYKQTFQC